MGVARSSAKKHSRLTFQRESRKEWRCAFPGHGLPSRDAGGGAGDLFVVVQTVPDARFERDGANLWHREELSVADAVLGTSLDVLTLNGHVKVTVPPATQPNRVLRLRGKGLPEFGGKRRADLFLRVDV